MLEQINREYGLSLCGAERIRDGIGQVSLLRGPGGPYVLKRYRQGQTDCALASIACMARLWQKGVPVPEVLRTRNGALYFRTPDGCVAVVCAFLNGEEVEPGERLPAAGALAGRMRAAMEGEEAIPPRHGKTFFVDRYVDILRARGFSGADAVDDMGREFWRRVENLPAGFCHGDFHAGNMLLCGGVLHALDFDACALAFPAYDMAFACDATHYFRAARSCLSRELSETLRRMDAFCQGYREFYPVSDAERNGALWCVAIRHYDIQATILACRGADCVDDAFLTNQRAWLENWLELLLKMGE